MDIDKYLKFLSSTYVSSEGKVKSRTSGKFISALKELNSEAVLMSKYWIDIIELNPERVYLVSDMHIGHESIIKYCSRPFNNVHSMNDNLLSSFLSVLKKGDVLIIVGDISMDYNRYGNYFLRQLPCDVVLVAVNHDMDLKTKSIEGHKVDFMCSTLNVKVGEMNLFLSHYPVNELLLAKNEINVHGHIHNRVLDKSLGTGGRHFNVSVEVIEYKPIKLLDLIGKFVA